DEIELAFAGLERVIARGQADGEFRSDLDPRMASYVFYGAIEEILTGWVLGKLEDRDEAIAHAEETFVQVICVGLAADRVIAKVGRRDTGHRGSRPAVGRRQAERLLDSRGRLV